MTEPALPVEELLRQGKAAANSHNNGLARQLLSQVVQRDPASEQGWLWLSGVVDDQERMRYCLKRVLTINPANVHAQAALRDFDELAPKLVPSPVVAPTRPPPKPAAKPARPAIRPRPASMIEGVAVQTVVQQHTRTMWAYIALWSSIMALHTLLFKAGELRALSFGVVASRVLLISLGLAGLQALAWAVGLMLFERRASQQTLGHTVIHAAISSALWPSSLAALGGLLLGALGILGGAALSTAGNLGRLFLLFVSVLLLVRGIVSSLDASTNLDRLRQQQVYQSLMVLSAGLVGALILGWIIVDRLIAG